MAKNSSKNKTPIIITAIILVVVILIAYIAFAVWRGTYNPTQWVSKPTTDITKPDDTNKPNTPNTPDKPDTPVTPDKPDEPNTPAGTESENDELLIKETASNGISLLSMPIAHAAEYISTQRVTVSVLPDNATDKDYTVTFNWYSEKGKVATNWVEGKSVSNYVNYTTTSNDFEIDINIKQRFNNGITCKIALKSNPEIYAEIVIGCYAQYKELTLITFATGTGKFEPTPVAGINAPAKAEALDKFNSNATGNIYPVSYNVDWDITNASAKMVLYTPYEKDGSDVIGTTERYQMDKTKISFQLSPNLVSALQSENITLSAGTGTTKDADTVGALFGEYTFYTWNEILDRFFKNVDYAKLVKCLKSCAVDFYIYVSFINQNGLPVRVYYNVNVLDSSLKVAANDIETDTPEIIF